MQRQNADPDALGNKRVTEQQHIALRAAAIESAHHDGETGRIFTPRHHVQGRPSHCDFSRNSHHVHCRIKDELDLKCDVERASLIAAGAVTLINFNAPAIAWFERFCIARALSAVARKQRVIGAFTAP
jgi:hypothetical protein